MAESTAARILGGYGKAECPISLVMWRGRPRPRKLEALDEVSREPIGTAISTSATSIPSADVPLITPATIIPVFLMFVATDPRGGSTIPTAPAQQTPKGGGSALRP